MNAKSGARVQRMVETYAEERTAISRRQKLMESCQGLVRSLAWNIHQKLPPHVDLEDLISFGQVGLAEAARDFDPERGSKFTTYAFYRIRGAIFDGLSTMTWFSRLDYHGSRYEHFANELLRLESGDEVEMGAVEDGVRWFKGVTSTLAVVHFMSGGRGEDDERRAEPADVSAPSPEARAMQREIQEKLSELIEALPSDARGLIRGFYYEGLTLREAGERLGISKAWASRLHARTLQRLAHSLRLIGAGE